MPITRLVYANQLKRLKEGEIPTALRMLAYTLRPAVV